MKKNSNFKKVIINIEIKPTPTTGVCAFRLGFLIGILFRRIACYSMEFKVHLEQGKAGGHELFFENHTVKALNISFKKVVLPGRVKCGGTEGEIVVAHDRMPSSARNVR